MSSVVSAGGMDGDGHLFWDCTFLPILHVRELPEFMSLMARDRSKWPRCLLWHGWLPGLSAAGERAPWADSLGHLVGPWRWRSGAFRADHFEFWSPAEDLAMEIGDHPCVWTDGSLEPHPTAGISVAGAGVFLPAP